ncbi:bifunctional DNA-formamidopyrimidine glycosylase/DNA-(apurinic or apyrimidinic site) lyase [Bermanella sp. WJH001]|uniref:bifunctional DNA-formamidopyrimidine glycosylase/DNA-(apurinic or apyrimidinic site) lyase n=1 Tax=Bermanella sp. WJH001 TaxID=3048005 RepID=UPI0024BDE377|nr:bifunctional DNA-formamidopyrimidine glycosylase/DNA-(apurinic or apyrimidinic site) lyase [Bermanella sp. WJH001]MDJ1538808.1 bifunctional DNA-formamidopyrimidine glycosylase/DNA-(apurinic or apyrimidinic site) lyase [Bermanella sp. WJH001]
MPELPEVETTCRGIAPHIEGKAIAKLVVRQPQLRWPIPDDLAKLVKGQTILAVRRRAKYILLDIGKSKIKGTIIIHLGMSGSLRVVKGQAPEPQKHEHFDLVFSNDLLLRFTDPRRFGACLWQDVDSNDNKWLDHLGPEPLSDEFNGEYLFNKSRKRTSAVKTFIMDQKIVVGVGNIYASESLFLSGISPTKAAGKISKAKYEVFAEQIKQVLTKAIAQGGTTLKDFVGSDGKPGYFAQQLHVYGRKDEPCSQCEAPIKQITQGQRSTFYCTNCQK